MKNDICTIPIAEIFEKSDGCPFCRMTNMLKGRISEYILGPAMMESSVRQETNSMGFCRDHLKGLMAANNKLPLALVLESHLEEVGKQSLARGIFGANHKKNAYKTSKILQSCFVCDKIEWGLTRLLDTTFRTYNNELTFRDMFAKQEFICLPHYGLVTEMAPKALKGQPLKRFLEDCEKLTRDYLTALSGDVHRFTKMFDYKTREDENADFSGAVDSIERAFKFLCQSE